MSKAAIALAMLLMASALRAQIRLTDNLPLAGGGQFMAGYSAADNGFNSSTRSLYVGIDAVFQGHYVDPRILSFNISPNWRWDHNSSSSDATSGGDQGLYTGVRFLGGSFMPLSANFNITRITESSLTGGEIPVTVESRGLNKTLNVTWNIHKLTRGKPDRWPALSLGYAKGWSNSSVIGVQTPELENHNTTYTATATYQLVGFHLTGQLLRQETNQSTPDLFHIGQPTETSAKTQSRSFSIGRSLFKSTSIGASYSHSNSDLEVVNAPFKQEFETANAQVSSNPWKPLYLSGSASYNSNVSAQTLVSIVSGGGSPSTEVAPGSVVPQLLFSTGRQFQANTSATLSISRHFQVNGYASHANSQLQGGTLVENESYGGGLTYSRMLLKGFLSLGYSPGYFLVQDSIPVAGVVLRSETHGIANSFVVRYARRIGRWQGNSSFAYSQSNIYEPLPLPLVSRSINLNLGATTRIAHQWNFSGNYSMSKTDFAGTSGSLGNSFSGSLSNRTWSFMGQFQFNDGFTVSTPFGLLPVAGVTSVVQVLNSFYTNSDGWSVSASYTRRRLHVTGAYSHAAANVLTPLQLVDSGSSNLDAALTYKFRRVDFRAGYRRLTQHISSNTALDQTASSYYFALVRQFRVF